MCVSRLARPTELDETRSSVNANGLSDTATVEEATTRDAFIDALRGVAILLVVLGHAMQASIGEGVEHGLCLEAICSFHMPLFFAISGYLFKVSGFGRDQFRKLGVRTLVLLAPYLFWTLLWHILYMVSGTRIGMQAAWDAIWFLPVLLACLWIHTIVVTVAAVWKPRVSALPIGVLLLVSMYAFGPTGFWFGSIRYHYVFFLAGAVLHYRRSLRQLFDWRIAVASIALWGLMLPYRQSGVLSEWYIRLTETGHGYFASVLLVVLRVGLALLAIYVVSVVVDHMPSRLLRLLSFLGLYTIQIYLIHLGFVRILCNGCSPLNPVFWLSVGAMAVIPIAIARVVEYLPTMSLIVFGRLARSN